MTRASLYKYIKTNIIRMRAQVATIPCNTKFNTKRNKTKTNYAAQTDRDMNYLHNCIVDIGQQQQQHDHKREQNDTNSNSTYEWFKYVAYLVELWRTCQCACLLSNDCYYMIFIKHKNKQTNPMTTNMN